MLCAPVPQNAQTPGIWNPLPCFDTVQAGRPARQHPAARQLLHGRAKDGTLPAVSWVAPDAARSASTRRRASATGQAYVTGLINAVMQRPRLELDRDLPGLGRLGRLLRPRRAADGRRATATACACPALVISPYAKQGYIDHQTLSFDAYLKFIEDDFLRRRSASTRRPTAGPTRGPTCARTRPILGNLLADFDFTQPPRPPLILPERPRREMSWTASGWSTPGGTAARSATAEPRRDAATLAGWPRRHEGRRARARRRVARVRRQRRRPHERLRRLRPPRAPRRPRPRPRHEGQARPRGGARDRDPARRGRSASSRPARISPPAAAVASRISPTRRSSRRRRRRCATRSSASAASPSRRSSRSFPASRRSSTTGTRSSTRSRDRGGPGARLPPSRPLGRGARDRALLAHGRREQRDPRRGPRLGARGGACGVLAGGRERLPAAPRDPSGTQHRGGARPAGDGARREVRARLPRRRAAPLPRSALDPLGRQRHAVRGDEPADQAPLGRRLDRGGALRAALPRPPERLPADEHARWPSGCTGLRATRRGSPAARPSGTSTAGSARSGCRSRRMR